MDDQEGTMIDIRESLINKTYKQMLLGPHREGLGYYAKEALSLACGFFLKYRTFPINFDDYWNYAKNSGFDVADPVIGGPISCAACRYLMDVNNVAEDFFDINTWCI